MAVYGYIRVSTADQNTARQFVALGKLEIPKNNNNNLLQDKHPRTMTGE